MEEILGQIPVLTKLSFGSERLSLFLTDSRIIVAHVGKRGAAGVVSTSILGKLSGAIEDVFKSGRESVGKRRMKSMGVKEILKANKDNFSIKFDEIVDIKIIQGDHLTGLTVLTRSDKLEFSTILKFDAVKNLLTPHLEGKITSIGPS